MIKGTRFIFLIIYVIIAAGCQQVASQQSTEESGEVTPEPTENVLTNDFFVDYVEGEYSVDINGEFLGTLIIKNDSYQFNAAEKEAINNFYESFFSFIEYPTGNIQYSYYGEMNGSMAITDLEDNDIILFITFDNPKEKCMYKTMLIRYYQDQHSLYFHAFHSEISNWWIEKELSP